VKKAIVFLELKGFSAMATQLARDMESIGFTPARVRAAGIHIVRTTLDHIQLQFPPEQQLHLGGDTWFFSYAKLEHAAIFSVGLLRAILDLATSRGIFFLKPSMAIGWGTPQLLGERVLDDESIHTYKTADTGMPFTLKLVGEARQLSASLTWLLVSSPREEDAPLVDWQSSITPGAQALHTEVAVPSLLLDSEIIY